MVYVTERERLALAVLGGAALLGMGAWVWQQRHAPIRVEVERPSALDTSSPAGMVPARSPATTTEWEAALQEARQVDLNAATAQELERLPDIGPSLAQRILQYRQAHGPFRRAEELLQVPGIGPKTYEALREHITVR